MTYCAAPYVTFFQFPKALAVRCCLVHLAQRDIHKCITVNQVSVEGLSVFQFDHLPKMCHMRVACWVGSDSHHGLALCGLQQSQRKLRVSDQ